MSQNIKDWLLALYLSLGRFAIVLIAGGVFVGRFPTTERLAIDFAIWYVVFRVLVFIYRSIRSKRGANTQAAPAAPVTPAAAPAYIPAAPAHPQTAPSLPAGTELKLPLKDYSPGITPGTLIYPGGIKAVVTAVSGDAVTAMVIQPD